MNPRIHRVASAGWVTWIIPTRLLLFLFVPYFFDSAVTLAGVSRVTAYHDPFWRTRTKRTTHIRPALITPSLDITTPETALQEDEKQQRGDVRTTPGSWFSSPIFQSEPSVNSNDLPLAYKVAPIYPHVLRNNTFSPVQNNILRPRQKPKGIFSSNEAEQIRNTNLDNATNFNAFYREPKLYSDATIPVNSPYFLEIHEDPYPRRKYRRRRLTRRRNLIHRYFQPQQHPAFVPAGEPETIDENLVHSRSHRGLPNFDYESFDSTKIRASQPPTQYSDGFTPEAEFKEERKDAAQEIGNEQGGQENVSHHKPKSNNNIVIYQHGATMKVNPRLPITSRTTSVPMSNSKSLSYRRVKPVLVEPDVADLHLSESFNPFLNASVPISTDLRNSLQHQYNFDLLYPLFNADPILEDVPKDAVNKTIDIKHKLSDSLAGVKITRDPHHELTKNPFMNHDGIITTDYDRQLHKTPSRISVKHSVSTSASSTTSSSSSGGNRAGGSQQQDGQKTLGRTTPMPVPYTSTRTLTQLALSPSLPSSTPSTSKNSPISPSTNASTPKPPTILLPRNPSILPTGTAQNFLKIIELTSSPSTPEPHSFNIVTNPLGNNRHTQIRQILTTKHPSTGTTTTTSTRSPISHFLNTDTIESPSTVTTYTPNIPKINFVAATIRANSTSSVEPKAKPGTSLSSTKAVKLTTPYSSIIRQNTKTPFTLRPKPIQKSETTTTTSTRKPATNTQPPSAASSTIISTFLDNTDEFSDTDTWITTTILPILLEESPSATISVTPKQKGRIEINKDLPLILMPPFTNHKEAHPTTLTTSDPAIFVTPVINETMLLQQLLGILNDDLGIAIAVDTTSPKPTTTTTLNKIVPTSTTTTTTKPTTRKKSTRKPSTTPRPLTTEQANLFNLLNLFAPTTTSAPVIRRPTAQNDFFGLLNLFQPTTTKPSQQNNDFFGLFNIFQQPTTTTTPAPPVNGLFDIFNLFKQTPRSASIATTTRRPIMTTRRTTEPAPAGDLLSLLNLFQQPTNPQSSVKTIGTHSIGKSKTTKTNSPHSDLDSFVQQALLESLGLKPGRLFTPQATTVKHQKASPATGLSDSDLTSIYALIEQQQMAASTTTEISANKTSEIVSETKANQNNSSVLEGKATNSTGLDSVIVSTTPKPKTTTLMPIFKNMLNLFGITDPTKSTPSSIDGKTLLGPGYNSEVTSPKPKSISSGNYMLEILTAEANKSASTDSGLSTSATGITHVPSTTTTASSFDILTQLLHLGQAAQDSSKASLTEITKVQEHAKLPGAAPNQSALDLQALLAQSWLLNNAGKAGTMLAPRPEVAPSESNIFHVLANQFTPRPQKPNGLYFWVDLNAFMGDNPTNLGGIRPKLGSKHYFVKL